MSISITRYVDITSGQGGQAGVPRRSFGLRQFTQNALVPAGAVVEFTSLVDVQRYFGTAADEYIVAQKYFGFVSKQISSPSRMSVVRWTEEDVAPAVYGSPIAVGPAAFAAITAGTLAVSVSGGAAEQFAAIDLSAAATFADVAAALQTELRTSVKPELATCLVQYDSNRGVLILTGGVPTGVGDTIEFVSSGVADLAPMAGWLTGLQVNAPGTAAHTGAEEVALSAEEDDNFGAFAFTGQVVPTTVDDIKAIAAWNHAQNVKFVYCVAVKSTNAAAVSAAVLGLSGCALSLVPSDDATDHAETIPAEILGATDYNRPAASQNYMYYRFGNRVPTVTTNPGANTFDALRVNYMGRTQQAGQKISFYQTGFLCGDETAPTDMAVYGGEMWMKDSFTSVILGGFLALPGIPANSEGRITLLGLMQGPIDDGLANGVISVGKEFDDTEKAYIGQVTNNSTAWRQVQDKGYWIDANIVKVVENNITTYVAKYVLVYGKNDQIRKVVGSNVLI